MSSMVRKFFVPAAVALVSVGTLGACDPIAPQRTPSRVGA